MDKLDPRMNDRLDKIDEVFTHQIKNIAIGVAAVVVAKNISQAFSMVAVDVGRRLVDLKLPIRWS